MEIHINVGKKQVTFVLVGVALIILAGFVFAGFDPAIPNPGHAVSQLQKCQNDGDVLKMVGGQWACSSDSPKLFDGLDFSYSLDPFPDSDNATFQSHDARPYRNYGIVNVVTNGAGYVLVQSTGEIYTYNAGTHIATVGIATSSNGVPPGDQWGRYTEEGIVSASSLYVPYAVSQVFYVPSAGSYTYYLVGNLDCAGGAASGHRLDVKGGISALYFPN